MFWEKSKEYNKGKMLYWCISFIFVLSVILLIINYQIFYYIKGPLWDFLDSNFSAAFFGAVGGSLTIILIEWLRRERQILADINASIGVLSGLISTLLNIKKQHILPLEESYKHNLEKRQIDIEMKRNNINIKEHIDISMYIIRFNLPNLHFEIPMDRIFTLADRFPQIVHIITQTKRSVGEVESIYHIWNGMFDKVKDMPEAERRAFYFGERFSPDLVDTTFPDTVRSLRLAVDDGLFFINKSIQSLTKLGQKTLPFWLRSKIARSEIVGQENKDLMPPDDYNKGWDYERSKDFSIPISKDAVAGTAAGAVVSGLLWLIWMSIKDAPEEFLSPYLVMESFLGNG